MLVKIWLYLTKAVITGDVDEVRVQSEEPNLKTRLRQLKRVFAFPASSTSRLSAPFQQHEIDDGHRQHN